MRKIDATEISPQKTLPTSNYKYFPVHLEKKVISIQQESPCESCHLRSRCLSKSLQLQDLRRDKKVFGQVKRLKKGQHLFRQDDEFKSLFLIRSGAAKSYCMSVGGEETVIGFSLPGEILGLDCLHKKQHPNSVMALENLLCCEYPIEEFEKLLYSRPAMQRLFHEFLSRQILHEQKMFLLQNKKSSEQKLAAFLLELSRCYEKLGLSPLSFRLPMPRKDIANHLGLAGETMSRLFSAFRSKRWISARGRYITLTDLVTLTGII